MNEFVSRNIDKIKNRFAKHKSIKDFEIYFVSKQGTKIVFNDAKKDLVEFKESFVYALRTFEGGKQGFSYGSNLDSLAIDKVIKNCVDVMEHSPNENFSVLADRGSCDEPQKYVEQQFNQISLKQKESVIFTMIDAAFKADARVKLVKNTTFEDEMRCVHIVNTKGVDVWQEQSLYDASVVAVAKENNQEEMGYDYNAKIYFNDINPDLVGRKAATNAISLLNAKPMSYYEGPVIFKDNIMAIWLRYLMPGFYASQVEQNNSFLKNKSGQKVYSSQLTLCDDPTQTQGSAPSLFDDEGVPTNKTTLIKEGVLSHYLYDQYWSKKLNQPNTGNAKRVIETELPSIHSHNVTLKKGNQDFKGLINSMQTGLVITDVLGAHTVNIITGDLSVSVDGEYYEKGCFMHPVKSLVLTGNLHDFFTHISEVSQQSRFFGRYEGADTLITKARVSGK